MATAHTYVNSHEDFFKVLQEATVLTRKYMSPQSDDRVFGVLGVLGTIEIQLDQMTRWTANGRSPTPEEIGAIYVGTLAFFNLQSKTDPEQQAFATRLMELSYYWDTWPEPAPG